MSQKRDWLRDNAFIAAAVALPLVVAGAFIAATALPRLWVDKPAHDFLFAIDAPYRSQTTISLTFRTDGNELIAEAGYVPGTAGVNTRELYRFHADSGELEHVTPAIPDYVRSQLMAATNATPGSARVPLPEPLAGIRLSTSASAPDGYRWRHEYARTTGFFGELFGMRGHRYITAVEHGGRVVEVPAVAGDPYRYYYNVQFLGWVIP